MARPNLDAHREQLRTWILTDKLPHQAILARLKATAGLTVSRSTLARRLHDWRISTAPKAKAADSRDLRAEISACHALRLTDRETLARIRGSVSAADADGDGGADGGADGEAAPARPALSLAALSRIRKQMGLYKQVKASDVAKQKASLRSVLKAAHDAGKLQKFSRSKLYEELRASHGFVGRDRVFGVAAEMFPELAVRRVLTDAGQKRRERDRARARAKARVKGVAARRPRKSTNVVDGPVAGEVAQPRVPARKEPRRAAAKAPSRRKIRLAASKAKGKGTASASASTDINIDPELVDLAQAATQVP